MLSVETVGIRRANRHRLRNTKGRMSRRERIRLSYPYPYPYSQACETSLLITQYRYVIREFLLISVAGFLHPLPKYVFSDCYPSRITVVVWIVNVPHTIYIVKVHDIEGFSCNFSPLKLCQRPSKTGGRCRVCMKLLSQMSLTSV